MVPPTNQHHVYRDTSLIVLGHCPAFQQWRGRRYIHTVIEPSGFPVGIFSGGCHYAPAYMFRPLRHSLVGRIRPPLLRRHYLSGDWNVQKARAKEPGKRSNVVLALLVLMPIVSFGLGTWQVRRLEWKQNLIATAESHLLLPPLDLPPKLNPDVVKEFDYRRVRATGEFDHSQEMLVGPRVFEDSVGYYVVTPLKRKNASTLLIHRGWIERSKASQGTRPESLIKGPVTVKCVLRDKPKKNMFTNESHPERREYYFMDIDEMARRTGAQPVYCQELYDQDSPLLPEQLVMRGIPIGAPAKAEFRNTHFQYILTWYGLCLATSIMLFSVWKQRRAPSVNTSIQRKLEHARKWQ